MNKIYKTLRELTNQDHPGITFIPKGSYIHVSTDNNLSHVVDIEKPLVISRDRNVFSSYGAAMESYLFITGTEKAKEMAIEKIKAWSEKIEQENKAILNLIENDDEDNGRTKHLFKDVTESRAIAQQLGKAIDFIELKEAFNHFNSIEPCPSIYSGGRNIEEALVRNSARISKGFLHLNNVIAKLEAYIEQN